MSSVNEMHVQLVKPK